MSASYEDLEYIKFLTDRDWTARDLWILIDSVSSIYNSIFISDSRFSNVRERIRSSRLTRSDELSAYRQTRDIESRLEFNEKLRIERINMASPGEIILKGRRREIEQARKMIATSTSIAAIDNFKKEWEGLKRGLTEIDEEYQYQLGDLVLTRLREIANLKSQQKLDIDSSEDRTTKTLRS